VCEGERLARARRTARRSLWVICVALVRYTHVPDLDKAANTSLMGRGKTWPCLEASTLPTEKRPGIAW
jgi:hypothetical protein